METSHGRTPWAPRMEREIHKLMELRGGDGRLPRRRKSIPFLVIGATNSYLILHEWHIPEVKEVWRRLLSES